MIFEDMKAKAVSLGKQLVEKEQSLDSRFVDANISDAELVQLVTEISVLHGKIRAVHLQAHLTQRAALTADQLMRYDALRGYQGPGTHGQHHGH